MIARSTTPGAPAFGATTIRVPIPIEVYEQAEALCHGTGVTVGAWLAGVMERELEAETRWEVSR